MNTTAHDETDLLAAFAVNGTAQDEENTRIEARVMTDAEFAGEIAADRKIREWMQARAPQAAPGELGLARLKREIAAQPAMSGPRTANDNAPLMLSRWRMAAVLAMAATVALAAALVLSGPGAPVEEYQLAGSGEVADGVRFKVAFAPSVTEAEMRALLSELDLVIVGGPSALGLYDVRTLAPDADEKALLARLRSSPRVIESARRD